MNTRKLIPVDGKDGWYRDPESNAIINANESEYDKYMAAYNRRVDDRKKQQALQDDVSELKSDMDAIKALLLTLVKNQSNNYDN